MADMVLDRPGQGQITRIPSPATGSRYKIVLNFNADAAEIGREDDSLIFKFEDGSVLELEKFYTEFSKENLPQFQIEDRLVAGMEFFKTFAPDIAPAAGLGNSARAGRFADLTDSGLMDGLSRLESLDGSVAYPAAFMPEGQGRLPSPGETPFSTSGLLPPLVAARGDEVFSLDNDVNGKIDIRTGQGNDTISLGDLLTYKNEDSVRTKVDIDTGAGNDTVRIGDVFTWGDVESFPSTAQLGIKSESGDNTITTGQIVTATDPMGNASASTELTVETGNGNDTITIGPAIPQEPGVVWRSVEAIGTISGTSSSGALEVHAGHGNNTITVNGLAVEAYNGSEAVVSAVISAGSGNDTIDVTDVLVAQETGSASASVDLRIDAGDGDNSVAVGSINLNGGNYYSNGHWQGGQFEGEITTGSGDDRISVGDIMQDGEIWTMEIAAGAGDDAVALSNANFGAGLVVLNGGAGLDALNLDEAGSFSMSAFLAGATVTGFEILDLRDAASVKTGDAKVNTLTFDLASLNGLGDDQLGGDLHSLFADGVWNTSGLDGKTGLAIHLDAGDEVLPSNDWAANGTITGADGTVYNLYINGNEYVLTGTPPVQPQGVSLPLSASFAADAFVDAGDVSLFGGMDMAFPAGTDGQPHLYGEGGEPHGAGLDTLLAGMADAPATLDGLFDQTSGAEAAIQANAEAIPQNLADMSAGMTDGFQPVPHLGENYWSYGGAPENVAPENALGHVSVIADKGMTEIEAATNDIMVKHSAA
jgi:hypothetical protein